MNTVMQWFMMHGYALYVWSAYGFVLFCLLLTMVHVRLQNLRTYRFLRRWWSKT